MVIAALASFAWADSGTGAVSSFMNNRLFASSTVPTDAAFMDAVRISPLASSWTVVAGQNNVVVLSNIDLNDADSPYAYEQTISGVRDSLSGFSVVYTLTDSSGNVVPLSTKSHPGGDNAVVMWESVLAPQLGIAGFTCDEFFAANGLVRDSGDFCWGNSWSADISGLQPGTYTLNTKMYNPDGTLALDNDMALTVLPSSG